MTKSTALNSSKPPKGDNSSKKKNKSANDDTYPLTPIKGSVQCIGREAYHTLSYHEWVRPDVSKSAICLHGLTRNGRDFDKLSQVLSESHRVICPDMVGRGQSGRLKKPSDYNMLQYNLDIAVLAAGTQVKEFDLIGTSLGGLVGIVLAALDDSPVQKLVVNDIAPEVPLSAAKRITQYLEHEKVFKNLTEVENHLRITLAPFGPMTNDDWEHMALHSSTELSSGEYVLAFDRSIADNFQRYWLVTLFNLWKYWDKITCPVLILRGKESDFLTESLRDRMLERLPHAELIEFDDVGHTPTLNAPIQIDPVIEWLNS